MSPLKRLMLVLGLGLALSLTAQAQSSDTVPNTPTKSRDVQGGLLGERVFTRLSRAHEQIGNEQYAAAYDALTQLRGMSGLSDYERAYIDQNMGHVRMAQERYNDAIQLFEASLNSNALPNDFHFRMMLSVAQIMAMQERYQDSQRMLSDWMAYQTEIPLEALQLQATNYASVNQYRQAIQSIDRAIAAASTPRENWYLLKLAMHFELKEYREAAQVLETLVRLWPDKNQYWTQLASMHMELKNEQRALSVMALAHRKGILTREAEWLQLFQLYAFLEVPLKAAQILSDGLEKGIIEPTQRRWEDLANAWYASKRLDDALEAFAKASALSTDGKLDMQRGHILIELERWGPACDALRAAISKGGIEAARVGNAHILIGMCELEQGNRQAARGAFQQARGFDRQRNAADQWIKHMDEEANREREARERERDGEAEEQAAGA